MRKVIKNSFVLQQDMSDCGVACLLSIIKFHGGDSNLDELRKLSGTTKQGTRLLGLIQASQQFGLKTEALEATTVDDLNEIATPAILNVTIDNRLQHYVVFYPNDHHSKKKFIIGDPAVGIFNLSSEALEKIWVSKILLNLEPSDTFCKANEKRTSKYKWVLDLIQEDYSFLLVSLSIGIGISILGLSTAILSQNLIDNILPKEDISKLLLSLVLVLILLLVRSYLAYIRGLLIVRQSKNFNNRIVGWFYSKLLTLPKSFFDTHKVGEITARLNDTRRIQAVLSIISGNIVIDLLIVSSSIGFSFFSSMIIGFVFLTALPIYLFILFKFNPDIVHAQKSALAGYALSESNFIDSIRGISDIKLLNKHTFFERVNGVIYNEFQNRLMRLGNLNIKYHLASEMIGSIYLIGVVGLSSWLVLVREIKLGEMVALLGLTGAIIPSINRLVLANIQIQEALVVFNRMYDFTSLQGEDDSKEKVQKQSMQRIDSVNVHNLSFRFPGNRQILKMVSLYVNKGEIITILGESGSGKSTLLQLLQKFYHPENGNILVDNIELKEIGTMVWRDTIGAVSQDIKIFNGTLLYNIVLSNQKEDHESAVAFCESTGLSKYFNEMPQGYFTLLGEEGINLSGGQQQLIALARVLWRKPKLLLLDEATSAMDRRTEKVVMNLINGLKADMVTILVTHKIRTASSTDRIYILEDGVISLSGTPDELLKTENFYSENLLEYLSK